MVRTDTHSPKNFDPATYTYVGSFDSYDEGDDIFDSREQLLELLTTAGFPGGNWEVKKQCDHCGARIRYVCVFRHVDGEHIATGEICADEAFGHVDRLSYDIDRLRKAAAAKRERLAREAEVEDFFKANEDLREVMSFPLPEGTHYIISDISHKLRRYGSISDKQAELVRKITREQAEKVATREVEEVKIPAPTGRISFTGKVVSVKEQWSDRGGPYGEGGYVWKMAVKMPEGYVVWVSVPAAITMVEVGQWVTMTATLKRSDRDESFAFGSRPKKAEIVDAPDGDSLD